MVAIVSRSSGQPSQVEKNQQIVRKHQQLDHYNTTRDNWKKMGKLYLFQAPKKEMVQAEARHGWVKIWEWLDMKGGGDDGGDEDDDGDDGGEDDVGEDDVGEDVDDVNKMDGDQAQEEPTETRLRKRPLIICE